MSLLDGPVERASGAGDETAYREGYARVMREMSWARAHGFEPSEREIVLALMQAMKVYGTVRGGKSIGGRRPEWLHGRADALRALLRNGVGAMPTDGADEDD
ncbi:MAG TPA: hypothetical protein VGS80_00760 [Ktedonobacterales bacterium]|nr:hypothetical protein [Ktedonobacterales bacterium]